MFVSLVLWAFEGFRSDFAFYRGQPYFESKSINSHNTLITLSHVRIYIYIYARYLDYFLGAFQGLEIVVESHWTSAQ